MKKQVLGWVLRSQVVPDIALYWFVSPDLCSCRDPVEEDLLRRPPTQRHAHPVVQLLLAVEVLLFGKVLRVPQALAARDNGNL